MGLLALLFLVAGAFREVATGHVSVMSEWYGGAQRRDASGEVCVDGEALEPGNATYGGRCPFVVTAKTRTPTSWLSYTRAFITRVSTFSTPLLSTTFLASAR